ncbi:FtsW/RodA/SpoVE family cell cycle protein [Riemerella columbipharyngis]|uniref:Probable peptidoglycan glycosyltransferase FtsW n=1 Tax=Riemerella columbipharyngis TaxID=1071918 RepID=A0A1G7F530_9FLAO|nr:FtsW/RodA/SpoVE family cell cycle protein [Riemerella columbipharyngis]SDE70856.1 cell division protein FtsW [Riemerella columbipharyngis]
MSNAVIKKFENFKGDKVLWGAIILLSILSIAPVYSASSNLVYIVNNGTTIGHIFKHIVFIVLGLFLMRFVSMSKTQYLGKVFTLTLILSFILLVITMVSGQTIEGASASRWLKIPGIGISFQPSSIAYLSLIIYLCRLCTKYAGKPDLSFLELCFLYVPILVVFGLVAKDNGSTAVMIFLVSLIVLILGSIKWKYVFGFVGLGGGLAVLFILVALNTNLIKGNRIHTWMSRIENFTSKSSNENDEIQKSKNYQVMQAKAAIVHGGIVGIGPGKSALKQRLPQSASDFIFAIIVEEYGLVGVCVLLFLYTIILFRIITIATRTQGFFSTITVLSLGVMIFVQLTVNIAVAVNIIPVTGQPLPLISYGGTSMLVTYVELGIILGISADIGIYDEEGISRKQTIEEINDIA